MPAYFEMSLQFLRKDLYPGFMTDFDAHLEEAGLAFFDGFWEDRGLSQKEIAAWNQKKLEKELQDMTDKRCKDIDELTVKKEKELMAV